MIRLVLQQFDQLKKLSEQINVSILPKVEDQLPIDIAKRALQFAQLQEINCLLFDTAGRINIDQTLMNELNQLEKEISPTETLLVLDSLTGQEAVNVATDSLNNYSNWNNINESRWGCERWSSLKHEICH